jgi:amino acid transporter
MMTGTVEGRSKDMSAVERVVDMPEDAGLRRNALGMPGLLAQSVANMAPAAAMALLPLLVFANAGRGTWISWMVALVAMLLVGHCIVQFVRRFATAGSFYVYVAKSFGPVGGMLAGWGLYLGYLATGMATVVGFGIYAGAFLSQLGLPGENPLVQATLYVLGISLPTLLAYRDIQLSARTELVLQILSAGVIALLVVVLWVEKGPIDTRQLTLSGISWNGIGLGVVLAIFSFVGFESSATLGLEAKDPFRATARAVLWSCALVGIFYVIVSYSQILGFEGARTPFEKSASPLSDLTGIAGLPWLGYAMNLGISFSMLACTLACINGGSRILFSMGCDGLVSSRVGRTHRVNRTPHVAIALSAPVMLVVPAILVLAGNTPVATAGYVGTLATFGFMLGYLLVSVAAPVYLSRIGEQRWSVVTAGSLAALAMAAVFVNNIYPVPAFPLNILPYVFLAYVLVGLVGYQVRSWRSPALSGRLGGLFETAAQTGDHRSIQE